MRIIIMLRSEDKEGGSQDTEDNRLSLRKIEEAPGYERTLLLQYMRQKAQTR